MVSLFKGLADNGWNLHFLSTNPDLLEKFKNDNNFCARCFMGPRADEKDSFIFFYLLLPFICVRQFFRLLYLKKKNKIETVVCFSWNERIIFTLAGRALKLKVVWVEKPSINYKKSVKFTNKALKYLSRKVKIIVFTDSTKTKLAGLGFKNNNIENVYFGIKTDFYEYQENIFSNLARAIDLNSSKGCFTIGVVTDLNHINQIENIFRAIKICLNGFSNLRLIIIGDGKEKKRVSWLAKKSGVEKYVYLVGSQHYLGKWWETFDVYLISNINPKLHDFNTVLKAMYAYLPVITFSGEGLDDIVESKINGFVVPQGDYERLAEKIIKLQQNSDLKKTMGEKAHDLVEARFSFKEQLKRLEEHL